jgi:hypothetical protein
MELDKIEVLLEKYFQAETSIAEETVLQNYFSSSNVAQHLEQYKPMFGFLVQSREQKLTHEIPLQTKKRNVAWLSLAASVLVLLGAGTFTYFNCNSVQKEDLGTYDNPEEAFQATQEALLLLSQNVNVGVNSVQYIEKYESVTGQVFKTN